MSVTSRGEVSVVYGERCQWCDGERCGGERCGGEVS